VDKGFQLAEDFRSAGYDVLVKLQGRLYPHADLDQLRSGADADGSITLMCMAYPPNGLSDIRETFDSVVYMSPSWPQRPFTRQSTTSCLSPFF
jgi:hypothetical protein